MQGEVASGCRGGIASWLAMHSETNWRGRAGVNEPLFGGDAFCVHIGTENDVPLLRNRGEDRREGILTTREPRSAQARSIATSNWEYIYVTSPSSADIWTSPLALTTRRRRQPATANAGLDAEGHLSQDETRRCPRRGRSETV